MEATGTPSTPTNTTASGTPNPFSLEAQIGLTSAYILIFSVALFGNSIGLYVVCTKAPSRRITDLLIKNLAVADLISTVTLMPLATISMYFEHSLWIGGTLGKITCKLVHYTIPVSIAASVITLTVISFDRLCAIFFPLSQVLFHKHKTITAIIWLTALVTMTPNLLLYQVFKEGDHYFCYQEWPWAETREESFFALRVLHVAAFVIMYALPLLVIAVMNSLIARRVWFHKSPGINRTIENAPAQVARRKVVKMLVAIIIVFALCWLPTYVGHYLMFFQPDIWEKVPIAFAYLMFWVSHANSAINPILYIAFNKNFRYAFLEVAVALFGSPCHAVSTCMVYIWEGERSTSDEHYPNQQHVRARQQSGFRVAPATIVARNGTGKTHETRL